MLFHYNFFKLFFNLVRNGYDKEYNIAIIIIYDAIEYYILKCANPNNPSIIIQTIPIIYPGGKYLLLFV